MKNYLLNSEDNLKMLYIKNFKINKDKVEVIFANNDKNNVVNDTENIEKLERKMKNQIEFGNANKEMLEKQYCNHFFGTIAYSLFVIILIGKIAASFPSYFLYSLLALLPTALFTITLIKEKNTLIDLEKSNLYIDNEKLYKEAGKTKSYVLDGLSKKSIKLFKKGLSINEVEKVKLKEMRRILTNEYRKKKLEINVIPKIKQKKM